MKNFEIMTDSTCDLSQELQDKYDIKIVPATVTLPDGREIVNNLKWDFMSREEFYKALKNPKNVFTTACPNYQTCYDKYEEVLKQGKDLIVINLSGSMSGTYGFSLKAAQDVNKVYPERKIYVIDSQRYSTSLGILCIKASILREQGYDVDYVAKWIETNKCLVHQMGYLDDLSFLAKKGRINHAAAFFGTLIGIKALGDISETGKTTVLGKVKRKGPAYRAIIRYMEETIVDPSSQLIFIAQTNHLDEANELKSLIEEKFHPKEIIINDVYVSCGVNVGPGLLAAYYFGTKPSKELIKEKEIMERIIHEK